MCDVGGSISAISEQATKAAKSKRSGVVVATRLISM